jgi:hypothetical protein
MRAGLQLIINTGTTDYYYWPKEIFAFEPAPLELSVTLPCLPNIRHITIYWPRYLGKVDQFRRVEAKATLRRFRDVRYIGKVILSTRHTAWSELTRRITDYWFDPCYKAQLEGQLVKWTAALPLIPNIRCITFCHSLGLLNLSYDINVVFEDVLSRMREALGVVCTAVSGYSVTRFSMIQEWIF